MEKRKLIIVIKPEENKTAIREAKKKKFKVAIISDTSGNYKEDIFIPMNDDSELSIEFLMKQIYILAKKINIARIKKRKEIFIKEIKERNETTIIKIKVNNENIINKRYFSKKIKEVVRAKNRNEKKKILSKICNFYNEKIKLLGKKKISTEKKEKIIYYIHNNKIFTTCELKKRNKKAINILLHLTAFYKEIDKGIFYKRFMGQKKKEIYKYIKRNKIKIRKIKIMK